jgi:xylan 1,4-beta-xylosidase
MKLLNRRLKTSAPPLTAMVCTLAALVAGASLAATAAPSVTFDWFEYTGRDAVFDTSASAQSYRNPILAGFYPDPSVTRAGDKFYLVNSTFAYFPGIPVFESTDLVHWTHVSNVIARPSQLDFDGLGVSRGVFAPSIEYHDGTFWVLNTAVDSGGNFFSTATSAAGPWSDPVWLKEIDGIDPSLFFDTDGKAYIVNNGPPEGSPQYDGHRAIWIQEFDANGRKLVGPRKVLINGGADFSKKPIWIEGPHIYRRDGWYYLMCAEGGTGPQHSEVILRAHSVWGPFAPYAGNPILTQRDLPADRANPITNAGHADLVEGPDGSWWALFLATRTYGPHHYNTGRETFLLPVAWRDGWPVILPKGLAIPYVAAGPKFMTPTSQAPHSGNFTWRDEFDSRGLNSTWLYLRVPKQSWADTTTRPGALTIHPLAEPLSTLKNPSFLGRRQQHLSFDASTSLDMPNAAGVAAGIVAFQNEKYWYFLGTRQTPAGGAEVFLERQKGGAAETLARTPLPAAATRAQGGSSASPRALKLRIRGEGAAYSFSYDADGSGWKQLRQNEDATVLSTAVAGGFVGVVLGPFARAE